MYLECNTNCDIDPHVIAHVKCGPLLTANTTPLLGFDRCHGKYLKPRSHVKREAATAIPIAGFGDIPSASRTTPAA